MRERTVHADVTIDDAGALPRRPAPRREVGARCATWIAWFGLGRLVAGALSTAVVVGGAWWLVRTPPPPTEATLPRVTAATTATASSVVATPSATAHATTTVAVAPLIVVHVAGAVADPGVHELPAGSRVVDAIRAAGGTVGDAAPDALNLAAVLTDAARVHVPRVGEEPPPTPPAPVVAGTTAPAGPVDLNLAGVDELDDLPGIGPATAAAIVEHRARAGPFATVDELLDVRGIGPAKLDAIRALVTA